jgi:hypothetical protein
MYHSSSQTKCRWQQYWAAPKTALATLFHLYYIALSTLFSLWYIAISALFCLWYISAYELKLLTCFACQHYFMVSTTYLSGFPTAKAKMSAGVMLCANFIPKVNPALP